MGYYYDTGIVCVGPLKKKREFKERLRLEVQKEILEEEWFLKYFSENVKEKELKHKFYGDERVSHIVVFYFKDSINWFDDNLFVRLENLCNDLVFGFSAVLVGEEWGDKEVLQNSLSDREKWKEIEKYLNFADSILYPVQYVELEL